MTMPASGAATRDRIDALAALLLVLAGMLSVLPSWLNEQLEMVPLVAGVALLLLNHLGRQPLRALYLLLLLLMLRLVLKGDERYLFAEISLADYAIIALVFAACHQLQRRFWSLLLNGLALLVPLAALVSHQLRRGAAALDRFNAPELSVNQTAFLLGACLTLSLCFLWEALRSRRPDRSRLLRGAMWLLISLLSLALLDSTRSRFGLGLPPLTVAAILALNQRHRLIGWLQNLSQPLLQAGRRLGLPLPDWLGPLSLLLLPLLLLLALALRVASTVYADPDNVLSDMHRLHLLRCYFSVPFSGHNRLIYGMGFTRASQTVCHDVGLIKGTTHAHNIVAQVAADNGLFAMLAVVVIGVWLLRQVLRQATRADGRLALATASLGLFTVTTLMIEGGWGKVSFLQALLGLTLASFTVAEARPAMGDVTWCGLPAGRDPGTTSIDP